LILAGFVNLRHGRLGSLRYFFGVCWEEEDPLAPRGAVAELGAVGQGTTSIAMSARSQPDPVTIRDYSPADWAAVCAVHDRARPDELLGSCDPRAFVPLADDVEDGPSFERSQKFVATRGDETVGFVGIDGTYLSWLYVNPSHYRHGIGRALLRFAVGVIGPHAWTVVLAENVRARRLYESEGFVIVRTSRGSNAGYPCTSLRLALPPSARAGNEENER